MFHSMVPIICLLSAYSVGTISVSVTAKLWPSMLRQCCWTSSCSSNSSSNGNNNTLVLQHYSSKTCSSNIYQWIASLTTTTIRCVTVNGKRRFVSRLVVRTSPLRRRGVDHTVLPANTPHLPLPRSSPEGATTEWTVIAPADEGYYSLIDPVMMEGWVGLVGWPTADGLPI